MYLGMVSKNQERVSLEPCYLLHKDKGTANENLAMIAPGEF
jgi:hypothetical protein